MYIELDIITNSDNPRLALVIILLYLVLYFRYFIDYNISCMMYLSSALSTEPDGIVAERVQQGDGRGRRTVG